jgi:hypothetical protein
MAGRIRNSSKISDYERQTAIAILEEVIQKEPNLLTGIDEINESRKNLKQEKPEITMELIGKIVQWDKKNKRLRVPDFVFMTDLMKGNRPLTDRNKSIALLNLAKVKKFGFVE